LAIAVITAKVITILDRNRAFIIIIGDSGVFVTIGVGGGEIITGLMRIVGVSVSIITILINDPLSKTFIGIGASGTNSSKCLKVITLTITIAVITTSTVTSARAIPVVRNFDFSARIGDLSSGTGKIGDTSLTEKFVRGGIIGIEFRSLIRAVNGGANLTGDIVPTGGGTATTLINDASTGRASPRRVFFGARAAFRAGTFFVITLSGSDSLINDITVKITTLDAPVVKLTSLIHPEVFFGNNLTTQI
jgi:hypothetical protein